MHDYTDPRATNPTPKRTGRKLLACFLLVICVGVGFICMGVALSEDNAGTEISVKRYGRIDTLDLALNHWGPTHDLIVECMHDGKIDRAEEKAIHDRYAQQRLDEMKWRLSE